MSDVEAGFAHALQRDDLAELNAGILLLGEALRMALLTGAIDADVSGGDGLKYLDVAEGQIIAACEGRFATAEPLTGACGAISIMQTIEGLIALARNDLANCRADVVK